MRMVPPEDSGIPVWQVSEEVAESSFERHWRPRGWRRVPETDLDISEMTVDEVLSEVSDDPEEALAVLIAERAGHDRVTLVDALTKLINEE